MPRSHNYASWLSVILGFLVFILRYDSPRPSFEVHRNLFLTGLAITFVALAAVIAHEGNSTRNYWSALNVVAGVWLLVSTKTIPSAAPLVTTGQDALGSLIVVAALVSLAIEIISRGRVPSARSLERQRL